MKWVSKVSLFVMGAMLATASRPVSANPVARMGGPESAINPDALMMAREGGSGVGPFLAILANPAAAGMDDPATFAYQSGRLNSLKALGLSGLGGIGQITACDLDVVNALTLALDEAIDATGSMLLEGQAAQDMIAALLGVPMLGLDSLAAVDELASSGDVNSTLAALLQGENALGDALAALGNTEVAEGITGDTTNMLGSSGSGGGAWYGGANWFGGANMGLVSNNKHYGGTAGGGTASHSSKAKHHAAHAAAAAAVPLPSGAWAGILMLAVVIAAHKARIIRPLAA